MSLRVKVAAADRKALNTALEDRLLAALDEHGPQTTGQLARLCGPYWKTRRVWHNWNTTCPKCDCVETVEVDARYMAVPIRQRLLQLGKRGQVIQLASPTPNNHGGNVWLKL